MDSGCDLPILAPHHTLYATFERIELEAQNWTNRWPKSYQS